MADFRSIPVSWLTLITESDSPTKVFIPATGWMSATGIVDLRAILEMQGEIGAIGIDAAYQVADNEDSPGASAPIGPQRTANGVYYPDDWTAVTANTNGAQLIRFAFLITRMSGSSPVSAVASMTVEARLG